MEKIQSYNALVVGRREPKIYEVVKILAGYFSTILRIDEPDDQMKSYSSDYFSLIVLTDSLQRIVDKSLYVDLRKRFPRTKLIGLFDHPSQEMEIRMRSAGLIYMGSYTHFSRHYQDIFQSAFKLRRFEERRIK